MMGRNGVVTAEQKGQPSEVTQGGEQHGDVLSSYEKRALMKLSKTKPTLRKFPRPASAMDRPAPPTIHVKALNLSSNTPNVVPIERIASPAMKGKSLRKTSTAAAGCGWKRRGAKNQSQSFYSSSSNTAPMLSIG